MAAHKVILFYGLFERDQSYAYVPWSMIYLGAYLRSAGFDPIIIDEFVHRDYEALLQQHAPDALLFGVSAMTGYQITSGLKASRIFRRYNPDALIAWGGAHPSALPEQTLEHPLVDCVFRGQSFLSLADVLKRVSDDPSPLRKQIISGQHPTRQELEQFPDFGLSRFDAAPYINPQTRLLNYCASIGCPGSCTFCSWGADKHPHHFLALDRILNDIEYLVRTYDLTTVLIQDSTFFSSKDFVMRFAEELLRRDLNVFWRADGRVVELARFSKEDMELLAHSGLDWIFLGVENTVARIMKMFHKIYPLDYVDRIIDCCRDVDITIFMSLIVGVPTETLDELTMNARNVNRWIGMSEKVYCQKCLFTPYPGTVLSGQAKEFGFREPRSLEEWATHPLFVDTMRSVQDHRPWLHEDYKERFAAILESIAPGRCRNNTLKPAGAKPRKEPVSA